MKNNFPALLKSSNTTRPKFFDFCFCFGFLVKNLCRHRWFQRYMDIYRKFSDDLQGNTLDC